MLLARGCPTFPNEIATRYLTHGFWVLASVFFLFRRRLQTIVGCGGSIAGQGPSRVHQGPFRVHIKAYLANYFYLLVKEATHY